MTRLLLIAIALMFSAPALGEEDSEGKRCILEAAQGITIPNAIITKSSTEPLEKPIMAGGLVFTRKVFIEVRGAGQTFNLVYACAPGSPSGPQLLSVH